MDCPLVLYHTGTLGTVDYLTPCECYKLCDFTGCKYRRCGILVQVESLGATTTNTIALAGRKCGGAFQLVAESNGAVVTNADLTAGSVYRIFPVNVNGVLRGIVEGI